MAKRKLKVKTYTVLDKCVENGIDAGWNRAHKYSDKPTEQQIKEQIAHYIMLEVDEHFHFDEFYEQEEEIEEDDEDANGGNENYQEAKVVTQSVEDFSKATFDFSDVKRVIDGFTKDHENKNKKKKSSSTKK